MTAPVDIAVVGHFSIDYLSLPWHREPFKLMGGPAAFVSLVTRLLGGSVSVISRVGADFPQQWLDGLQQQGVDVSAVTRIADESTTSFELHYDEGFESRKLCIRNKGSPIAVTDLPQQLRAKVLHIAPIADEISYDVVKQLRSQSTVLSIDPQGMIRRFDELGRVSDSACMDKRVLELVDIYRSSFGEIQSLTGESDMKQAISAVHDFGPRIVIATSGSNGSILSVDGNFVQVPTCKPERVLDPTGAGDVFIGALLNEYINQKDPYWCACVGSAAASFVVEDVGTRYFGSKEEILSRAALIYKKK
jgi:sugar/nucleoside kinase (ribokinase family)